MTMNDLVKETTGGLDVLGFGADLEGAKAAALEAVEKVRREEWGGCYNPLPLSPD